MSSFHHRMLLQQAISASVVGYDNMAASLMASSYAAGLPPPPLLPPPPPPVQPTSDMGVAYGSAPSAAALTEDDYDMDADSSLDPVYSCSVCSMMTSGLNRLHRHVMRERAVCTADDARPLTLGQEPESVIVTLPGGAYACTLCTYQSTLKANFQVS